MYMQYWCKMSIYSVTIAHINPIADPYWSISDKKGRQIDSIAIVKNSADFHRAALLIAAVFFLVVKL